MEVKINREIRNYTESMFFGLSIHYTTPINISIWGKVVVLVSLSP